MKRNSLRLLFALLLSSQFALAQDEDEISTSNLEYGAKIGGNFNQFSQPGVTFGGNVGIFARYSLTDLLAVRGELLYDYQGGGRHDFDGQGASFQNRSIKLHTISLPISLKISPFAKENITPYFAVGGSVEYVASAFEVRDIVFTDGNILTRQNANISDDIDDIQYGFHVGAGFDFYQSDGKSFGVEIRWRQSLKDLNSGSDQIDSSLRPLFGSLYSSTMSLSLYASLNSLF